MDELVRWLGEQLSIDAARAEAACNAEFCKDGRWTVRGPFEEGLGSVHSEASEAILGEEESVPFALADHIAAHDPARVLAEIDAKRQILALHAPVDMGYVDGEVCMACDAQYAAPFYPCKTVRLLALPHASRPGFKESWRP